MITKKAKQIKKVTKPVAPSEKIHRTRIRVIGIGGGGGSIVSEIAPRIKKVDFMVANTDLQALKQAPKECKVFQFGEALTHGLGCGMDPKLGQKAAQDKKDKIAKLFQGIDLCILIASLGGGTGSGASPEFASIAKDLRTMTLGIFTLPFKFEGGKRAQIARDSLEKLKPNLNAINIIPNEKIFQLIDKKTPLREALSTVNKVLSESLEGLIEMIYLPGLINIDFADLRTILEGEGKLAYLQSAEAQGPNRAEEAIKKVLQSPLNEYDIKGAENILFNIAASEDLGMREVEQISKTISDFNSKAKIIFGVSQDKKYNDKIRITLLAVGCGKDESEKKKKPKIKPKPEPKPEPKPKPKPEPKLEPKPKLKPKPLSSKAPRAKEDKPRLRLRGSFAEVASATKAEQEGYGGQAKPKLKSENATSASTFQLNSLNPPRRNALELKKQAAQVEQELIAQEKKWDTPAFLRRRASGNQ